MYRHQAVCARTCWAGRHFNMSFKPHERPSPTTSWTMETVWLTDGFPTSAFAGKDATRALALMSTKKDDVVAGWEDLSEKEKGVLDGWVTYFSKRYNVVGVVDASSTAS